MQLIGIIVAACLVISALRTLLAIMVMACIITLLLGMLLRPRETFPHFLIAAGCSLLQTQPQATVSVACALVLAYLLRARRADLASSKKLSARAEIVINP